MYYQSVCHLYKMRRNEIALCRSSFICCARVCNSELWKFRFLKHVQCWLGGLGAVWKTDLHGGQCPGRLALCWRAWLCAGCCLETISCAVVSHPHGNQHFLMLHSAHTGHAKGTVSSCEIIALSQSSEKNKRNFPSAGSTPLAHIHLRLHLLGELPDLAFCHPERKGKRQERGREIMSKEETCTFILSFSLRAADFPTDIFS